MKIVFMVVVKIILKLCKISNGYLYRLGVCELQLRLILNKLELKEIAYIVQQFEILHRCY